MKLKSSVAVACSLPGLAMDLSAPLYSHFTKASLLNPCSGVLAVDADVLKRMFSTVHSHPTALRLCWCAPTYPFVMLVLAVTGLLYEGRAAAQRSRFAFVTIVCLSVCLSVCLCGSTPHFTRHFSMGPRVETC